MAVFVTGEDAITKIRDKIIKFNVVYFLFIRLFS